LASALCLAFLFTPLLSKAQTVDTTGNLVNFTNQATSTTSTWQNAGSIGQPLTCWQGGDPGYCGPLPRVAAWGSGSNVINFSYGLTNLNQIVNVNNALTSAGTGLQVNGFNFSFQAKNGNGWDNGMQDYLTAYVNIYNNTNSKVLESYNYDLNRRYNWTQFSYSETFKNAYAAPNVGNAVYGFIGRDNNFWVGPYGPEVTAVNFSLKYSIDPCTTNALSSPSCPGYLAALAKLAPAPVAASPEIAAAAPPATVAVAIAPPSAPQVQEAPQQAQPGLAQPGAPTAGSAPQQAASQPSATNQQPKAGEVADSGGGGKSSSVSLSSVLSMISSNQDKTSSLEKSVVQSADAQAFSAGETAKQQAEKIAGDMQSQSMSTAGGSTTTAQTAGTQSSFTQTPSSMVSLQGNQQSSNSSNAARIQQSINSSVSSQSNILNFAGTTTQQSSYQNTTRQETTVAMVTPQVSYSLVAPTRASSQPQVEIPMLEGIKFGVKNAVDSAMESKPFMPQMNDNSQQNDGVKKNVDNNELAGNITIESIAKQPANYAQYFFMIPDVAFYAPKEIYRNQKTVDNVRALRQMSSDRLHQQMVDQQYK